MCLDLLPSAVHEHKPTMGLIKTKISKELMNNRVVAKALLTNGGKVGSGFWDNVDTALQVVRETHKEDSIKITQVFTRILTEDQATYTDFGSDENLDRLAEVLKAMSRSKNGRSYITTTLVIF
ncbi:hypothetical protein GGU10DRAFT_337736 [Lentinula aff. detonsa]|uniref:Uncharacterized protein n=1 Tax=Lentinula aff. detonsa TaxID=2804958 RepID=A0AA38KK76_9AGAR|nr:hypothetical protein GGU10DRAFT_337736 [Lentinula aff. detonsa]